MSALTLLITHGWLLLVSVQALRVLARRARLAALCGLNIASTALGPKSQKTVVPRIPQASPREQQFHYNTENLLDEARASVENAVGEGQTVNPLVYAMLGLQPQYEETGDLQGAQQAANDAQNQLDTHDQNVQTLRSIPKRKRSKAQRQQLKNAKTVRKNLIDAVGKTKDEVGRITTTPRKLTGLTRMDPSQIPADSPFSAQNPLNQAQATEADRLNAYLKGGEVDPTLKHQYDAAEQSLRAKLSARFGPDYENTSVGQMALQNFSRQKNEAFATWNQQMVDQYNQLAFSGAQNLQTLLANKITLMREPSTTSLNEASQLANLASGREGEESLMNQMRLGRGGVSVNAVGSNPMELLKSGTGGLASLLTPNAAGQTPAGTAANWVKNLFSSGAGAAATEAATTGGLTAATEAGTAAAATDAAAGVYGAGAADATVGELAALL